LHKSGTKHYIEITVPVSSIPISYHGTYHYRSGSTKQELKGIALQNLLLKKIGKKWEDLPVEGISLNGLNQTTIRSFLSKAIEKGRVPQNAEKIETELLLKNLSLITEQGELAGYIESWGRGINKIIETCVQAGLQEPVIEEEQGGFSITFLKDIYKEGYLRTLPLDEDQIKVLLYIKENGSITNSQFQQLIGVSKRTATRQLQELIEKGFVQKSGTTGKGTSYILHKTI
jgi:predicted HTH transcriptional regulator